MTVYSRDDLPLALFRLSWGRGDYDTFDGAIVAADDEIKASRMHPNINDPDWGSNEWAHSPSHVTVERIGTAVPGTQPGVILASYNAG